MNSFTASITPTALYARFGHRCLLIGLFFIPVKLSIAYAALLPALVLWLISKENGFKSIKSQNFLRCIEPVIPLAIFFAYAVATSFFSSNIPHSIGRALKALALLGFIPYFVYSAQTYSRNNSLLPALSLICGQCVASFHTTLNSLVPITSDDFFIGAVSESGQLAVTIPFTAGLMFALRGSSSLRSFGRSALPFLGLALFLMLLALLINLKRGPWLGTTVGLSLLFFFYRPKLIIPLLLGTALLVIAVPPIHDRLAVSVNHFFIGGGRSQIWSVGLNLIAQNPLGVGFDNSRIMQAYDPMIPDNLKHMHNNLLNLLVETGWIGASLFIYWFVHLANYLISIKHSKNAAILARSLLCSLVSWQIAGLVEYNIGDTEVLLVVLFLTATVLELSSTAATASNLQTASEE